VHDADQVAPTYRYSTGALGRWGRGPGKVGNVHSLRKIGLSPMRCSSTTHSSTVACGKAVATARRSGRKCCLKSA
jgi:hypothetical protein